MSLRPSIRAAVRKKEYKSGVDGEDARRRRVDILVEIRKTKREDNLLKKRREGLLQAGQVLDLASHALPAKEKLDDLPAMTLGVWSAESHIQLRATTQFRKLLSFEKCPPIEVVIKAGVVPRFVEFLSRSDLPQLQFEAGWILTNVASGTSEQTRVVVDHGAVPKFVQLLSSPSDEVREQAVWALGNVAGDSSKCRDIVLENAALFPLLALLNEGSKISMIRNATWTLSNLVRGNPRPAFEQIRDSLPVLQRLVHSTDEEVLSDACWALSYMTDGANDRIQAVIGAGVCQRLVELIIYPSPTVLVPALRTVGNIVSGDDVQTQCILDNGVLPCLFHLLTRSYKKSIKKEACWTISNITAGTGDQIQAVIDANIISPLVHLLMHAEFDIKKEAAWAISNATSGGSTEQIHYLASQGCIKPMCDLLTCSDPRVIRICLDGLKNILKAGEDEKDMGRTNGINIYAQMIDECEGLDKIHSLQGHGNNEIYEKSVKLLEKYWIEVEENGEESAGEACFGFGYSSATNSVNGDFKFT
ncbi:importin subunit alpha-like [Phalaenopsis equestris]|uniref:importin subunit alpha-like n=1 Tax=Phalaenopsis equestris TaxID=78828 RepID=UPI0009E1E52F|nr:importin subunit alpha-like [Phalaenopsis equestris]